MLHWENSMNFMQTFPTKILMTTFLAALSYSTHAFSADEYGGGTVTVRYDDLNLSSPAGVDTLKRRVSSAAAQVCPVPFDDPVGRILQHSCISRAIDKA